MRVSSSSRAARSTSGRRPRSSAALATHGTRESAVVLDLRGVTFMDSSGLGLIVESNQRARKHGFRFAVAVGGASDVAPDPRDVGADEGAGRSSTTRTRSSPAGTRDARGRPRSPASATCCGRWRGRARPARGRLGGDPARPAGAAGRAACRPSSSVVLTSRFAMWMAWGPELTFFCNDAYRRDTLGKKYPWALGRSAREVWAEIWPDIGPRIETVMRTGDGDLGRGAAAVPRAQRLRRGDLPHVLLQPADRRRRRDRRDAVRRQRGHRAGHRRAPAWRRCATSARRRDDAAPRTRCSPPRPRHLAANRARPAVRAGLPLRRGRRRAARCASASRDRAAGHPVARRRRLAGRGSPRRGVVEDLDRSTLPTGAWDEPPRRRSCCRSRSRARARRTGSSSPR